jgi:asparagine synthase (glutamine-hydrolysing)
MFLLSRLVRESGFKVVLTGEGADELLGGYDIFKEAKVRRYWAKHPESTLRPLLLKRLYRFVSQWDEGSFAFQKAFFRRSLTDIEAFDYSHGIRWQTTRRALRFLSDDIRRTVDATRLSEYGDLAYPKVFRQWSPLAKAQYLEILTFLSPYLLSSQGDRMAMAHSIEGRYPFLDHRLVEFCSQLPDRMKLKGLNEKYLLKTLGRSLLPVDIFQRRKRPYRAPIQKSFFGESTHDYVKELLSSSNISAAGLFQPAAVKLLVNKLERGLRISETDEMALVGILSSQILHHRFVVDFRLSSPDFRGGTIKIHRALGYCAEGGSHGFR